MGGRRLTYHAASAGVNETEDFVLAGSCVGVTLVIPLNVLEEGVVSRAVGEFLPLRDVPELHLIGWVGGWVGG